MRWLLVGNWVIAAMTKAMKWQLEQSIEKTWIRAFVRNQHAEDLCEFGGNHDVPVSLK